MTEKHQDLISSEEDLLLVKVRAVRIRFQTCLYVPQFSESFAKTLKVVVVYQSNLMEIEKDDLMQFPELAVLSLSHNKLTNLSSDLFVNSPNLEFINFRGNPLKVIGPGILDPLTKLTRAWFSETGCIDMEAKTPKDIENLRTKLVESCAKKNLTLAEKEAEVEQQKVELEKEKVEVEKIKTEVEKEKAELGEKQTELEKEKAKLEKEKVEVDKAKVEVEKAKQEIDKEKSELEKEKTELEKLKATSEVDKERGEIKIDQLKEKTEQLEKELKEEKKKSKKFYVCDKNLNAATKIMSELVVPDESASSTNNETLLCHNYTEGEKFCLVTDLNIPDFITAIKSVEDDQGLEVKPTGVFIRQQALLFLPTNLHAALPGLEHLEVSETGVFAFDKTTFSGLEELISLNLTRNKILEIPYGVFFDLLKLQILDLSSNFVETIVAGAFDGTVALAVLNLSDNHIKIVDESFLIVLNRLDVIDLTANFCTQMSSVETPIEEIKTSLAEMCVLTDPEKDDKTAKSLLRFFD